LLAEGIPVVGIDDLSQGKLENVPKEATFIHGDLAQPSTLRALPDGIEYILHLAGQSSGEISFDDPVADLCKNTVSTLNLIQWAIGRPIRRFVYASSMAVYGPHPDHPASEVDPCQPLSCYGVGKLAAEHYLGVYAKLLPSVILRMFNVYGPGQDMENMRQGMVSIFLNMALTQGCVQVRGRLDRYRDFVFIEDVVDIWVRAMRLEGREGRTLNVGAGRRTTVEALLKEMARFVPGMTWHSGEPTAGDQFGIYADTAKLRQVLGVCRFTDLSDGLPRFVEWARQALDLSGKRGEPEKRRSSFV
jgi:UDP-glucose 4-epimerase